MNIFKNELISLSIIDVVGQMDGGLAILFNLLANDLYSYEVIFWYNKEGTILIEPEEKLLKRLNITDIKEYDKLEEMCFYFYSHIPNPDELLVKYIDEN